MKREERKKNENIEKLGEVLEEKKKIPKVVKEKINSKVFENMIIAAIVMIYLAALNFGMYNIPTDNYKMDLRVFSIILCIGTVIIFEYAYKKDEGSLWIHGIELMVISIFTLYLIYLYSLNYATFSSLIVSVAVVFLVYYSIKLVIIQRRIEKEYKKSLIDIDEIVKK